MTTTASIDDAAMPAMVAAGWPKRRDIRSIRTRGVAGVQLGDDLLGAIGRRVDGEDQFPVVELGGVEHLAEPGVHPVDVGLLVVRGHHHRQRRGGHEAPARLPGPCTSRPAAATATGSRALGPSSSRVPAIDPATRVQSRAK